MDEHLLLSARARVLADLEARRTASAEAVSLLEEAMADRQWWVEQWADGEPYVAGLVAQDVQDQLLDRGARWPVCDACGEAPLHTLHIEPDLGGPDPMWVCEESGREVAPLGGLRPPGPAAPTS